MKTIAILLMAPLLTTVGQLLIKCGMSQIGPIDLSRLGNPLGLFKAVVTNPYMALAIPIYIGSLIAWVVTLSKFDLSYAYPFFALSFVLIPVLSWVILGENIPIMRWLGLALVTIALVKIGSSSDIG